MTYEHNIPAVDVAELLARLGYKAEQTEHGVIKSSFSGTRVLVKAYDDGSLQLIAAWGKYPVSFDLKAANEFNANFRFGSVYLRDSIVTLQSNFLFDPAEEDAEGTLQKAASLFEGLISELVTMMLANDKKATDN